MNKYDKLSFSGRILDNVHGFIYYTETEEKIMNTLLFKRLQSIKQLSIVNWVFPGSEHTRYIHSLGVMYLADKIAHKLDLSLEEIKLVRLAGLLHDLGHYPLSHVCEYPYKESLESFPDDGYCKKVNQRVKQQIDQFKKETRWSYMKKSSGCHHEQIGAELVCSNREIRQLIVDACGNDAPEIIADMITGNVDRKKADPLLVQILHSELDADGIDYLMRDAMFSGTSFGAFELDQLIGCMEVGIYQGKKILCISPKGIAAADQYLINKFFSYSQVVFNKHISITEWMAGQIVDWMQKNNAYFPRNTILKKWVKEEDTRESYIDFTDNFFWSSLQNMLSNELVDTEPTFIKYFCSQLLRHRELACDDQYEIKLVSRNFEEIHSLLTNSSAYPQLTAWTDKIAIFSQRAMSKQVRQVDFDQALEDKIKEVHTDPNDFDMMTPDDITQLKTRRFMECICVLDHDKIHLLCDDKRSMMQTIYDLNLIILRAFDFTPKSTHS